MIRSPLLETISSIEHGFGTRESEPPAGVVTAKQVHGVGLLEVREIPPGSCDGFDILLTGERGVAVAVKTADCLPILMVEPRLGVVAAVHAGWRGTVARVVEKAVEKIVSLGGKIGDLAVALGPNMGGACYEVEADVMQVFTKEFDGWPVLTRKSPGKWLLDVAETNTRQLLALGVRPGQIDRIDFCTHCRVDLFHSYRRDREKAARMINFITLL